MYKIRIPWQDNHKDIEIVEVIIMYSEDLNSLSSHTVITDINYENALLYEVLLNINFNLKTGRVSLCKNRIVYQNSIENLLTNNHADLSKVLKVSLAIKIAILKIVNKQSTYEELIENDELTKSDYIDGCIMYISSLIKEMVEK